MSAESGALRSYTLEGIAYDAMALLALVNASTRHPKSALITPGIIPLVSLFAVETNKCLAPHFPELRAIFPSRPANRIRVSRHRTKILDDANRPIGEVTGEIARISAQSREHFTRPHVGILGYLKRLIQPDLGLSTYNGHVFSTTHATTFNTGLDYSTGMVSREIGEALGSYLVGILNHFQLPEMVVSEADTALPGQIHMMDIQSEALYRRGALGTMALNDAAGVSVVLAGINYTHYILRGLMQEGSPTFLKLRFLCAYHADSSISTIQNNLHRTSTLPQQATTVLGKALGTPEGRWLRKQGRLRNLLVHYVLGARDEATLSATASHRDVVNHVSRGLGWEDLGALLDCYLRHISCVLEEGFSLSRDTFLYGRVK